MSAASPFLSLQGLEKSFGDVQVLRGLSLDLAEGEILALLGLSGSGKTTALRLLAGFESPDQGTIRVGGEEVGALPPAKRGFGMVFQHYALFPHLTVSQNVAFGLESQKWDRARIPGRVGEMLALVGLQALGAHQLDRHLAVEPAVAGEVHHPFAAATDFEQNFIASGQSLADQGVLTRGFVVLLGHSQSSVSRDP